MSVGDARLSGMEQRLSFVTLAVADVEASSRFYRTGLGWQPELDVPGEVVMFRVADKVMLSLWDASAFAAELGAEPTRDGIPPITLAHNCHTIGDVDRVLEQARSAGATIQGGAQRDWGGYSGYFVDPDGFRWEVAFNPGEIGRLVLP